MSSKSSRKVKKPLDLPLGKASSQKDVDLSHVRLPIDTSVFGLKHVLTLFETATSEVKSYLAYECDLMYECRVCRTIFRSIANFILHKRKFCRDKYNTPRDPGQCYGENDGVTVIQRDIDNANKIIEETEPPGTTKKPGHYLNPIIEKLLKRQEQMKFVEDLKKKDPTVIPKHEELKKVGDLKSISLEKIDGSDVAVFQTIEFGPNSENTEMMKSEVMEIHSIFDNDEAVIGSNGKILTMNSKEKDDKQISKYDYTCTDCNTKFSTKKTLTYHIKYKHSDTKLVYPCPLCKDNLANAWSVYRHLLKVHRMTSNQIRKYRNQINNSAIICKKTEVTKDRRKSVKDSKHGNDEENEWLDNIEGDSDLQMCGGCGKHFERKAALISHSVMCTKRIAVCNSIKENSIRKKESENEITFKTSSSKVIGSAKRKTSNLIMYKTRNSAIEKKNEKALIESSVEDEEVDMDSNQIDESTVEDDCDMDSLKIDPDDVDSDTDCPDWMNKDIQMYDKDEVMSIIGVDIITPITTNEHISSKVSDRSDSPCRGFETVKASEYLEHLKIDLKNDLSNLTKASEHEILSFQQVAAHASKRVDHISVISCNSKSETSIETALSSLGDKTAIETVLSNSDETAVKTVFSNVNDKTAIETIFKNSENESAAPTVARNSEDETVIQPVLSNSEYQTTAQIVSSNSEVETAAETILSNSEEETATEIVLSNSKLKEIAEEVSNIPEEGNKGNNHLDVEIESRNSDNFEYKSTEIDVTVSTSTMPSKSSSESETENSSEISLDNRNNSDFKLDLCNDPNFQDVSIKSLIKEIIDEDAVENEDITDEDEKIKSSSVKEKIVCNGLHEVETRNEDDNATVHCIEDKRLNNNHDVQRIESLAKKVQSKDTTKIKKRKRINSTYQQSVKKKCNMNAVQDVLNPIDDEVFLSKIAHFADISNLHCGLCESQFNLLSDLLPHMSNHLSWYRFQCSRCSFMSFNRRDCQKHVLKEHKVRSIHIQGTVLPIPTWKASLISENFMLAKSSSDGLNDTQLDTDTVDKVNMSVDMQLKAVKLEALEIPNYIDLTVEESADEDTDCTEANKKPLLKPGSAPGFQDLSKQAIMEVILGNENRKGTIKLSEHARTLRNTTKCVKTSQNDFVYDIEDIKGHNSKVDAEHIPEFEVQE